MRITSFSYSSVQPDLSIFFAGEKREKRKILIGNGSEIAVICSNNHHLLKRRWWKFKTVGFNALPFLPNCVVERCDIVICESERVTTLPQPSLWLIWSLHSASVSSLKTTAHAFLQKLTIYIYNIHLFYSSYYYYYLYAFILAYFILFNQILI